MSTGTARPTRGRILDAAASLLVTSGIESVSIRDVCDAAGVTAPAVYHHFGDKKGLFEAVVAEGFERYLTEKRQRKPSADPVADLRRGWDGHVEFGRTHPAFYALMYGTAQAEPHPAAREGEQILLTLVQRVAETGRLRMPPEQAAPTIHAATVGTTLILIANPDAPGVAGLSERLREAVLDAVVITDAPRRDGDLLPAQAEALLVTLTARAGQVPLTDGELAIFLELLDKLVRTPATRSRQGRRRS